MAPVSVVHTPSLRAESSPAKAGGLNLTSRAIKGMGVALGPTHYQQAATYAVNEGTRWAIVTNGRVWAVIDEHLPGRWEERVALKLELGQEGETFAADLATLLDAETWRKGAFEDAVRLLRDRQQRRIDEARIHRDKRPEVEALQVEYGVATFESAAQLAARLGVITEGERDVLLGVQATVVPASVPPNRPVPRPPVDLPAQLPSGTGGAEEIHFTYRIKEAEAHAVYRPAEGTWMVLAGSTALNRVGGDPANARALDRRRRRQLQDGQIETVDEILLRYVREVRYTSPSLAAVDISGAPKNGWDVWKDVQGRPAQHYRPKNHAD